MKTTITGIRTTRAIQTPGAKSAMTLPFWPKVGNQLKTFKSRRVTQGRE